MVFARCCSHPPACCWGCPARGLFSPLSLTLTFITVSLSAWSVILWVVVVIVHTVFLLFCCRRRCLLVVALLEIVVGLCAEYFRLGGGAKSRGTHGGPQEMPRAHTAIVPISPLPHMDKRPIKKRHPPRSPRNPPTQFILPTNSHCSPVANDCWIRRRLLLALAPFPQLAGVLTPSVRSVFFLLTHYCTGPWN